MRIFLENVKLAFASILSKKGRATLTVLGVMIGVFAITELLGVGLGVKKEVEKQIADLGTNIVVVLPGKLVNGAPNPASSLGPSTLKITDLGAITGTGLVDHVTPIMLLSGQAKAGAFSDPSAIVFGVSEQYGDVYSRKLAEGRFFTAEEAKAGADLAVLGHSTALALFPNGSAINATVRIQNHDFTVIGVYETSESTLQLGGANAEGFIAVPFETAKRITGTSNIARFLLHVKEGVNVDASVPNLVAAVKANHNGEDDFSMLTQKDLLKLINSILNILTALVTAIASVSLVVGGIGIMNIMLVSVSERTREIGLRKAVGASNGDILAQFLTEAVTLTVMGAAVGVLFAFGTAQIVGAKAGFTPVIGPSIVGLALGFAVIVGAIFGMAPAIRAARLHPIDALRYE